MNRAAFKLVEMDSVFGLTWEFAERDLCFVDVCGGPGSWTEYVMWRRAFCDHHLRTFGYGMTLVVASLDWNAYKMNQWSKSMYRGLLHENARCKALYGPRQDGDVTRPDNIHSLVSKVHKRSNLFLADGGFDVSESPNEQERLSQRLFLCQMALGMSVLAERGHLVCKLFDAFTQPTQDIIYIASRCFSEITLYKPVSSRPANSERYLVCKGFLATAATREAVAAMLELNEALERTTSSSLSSLEHCPEYAHTLGHYHQSMLEDEAFVEYLRERNDTMTMSQISHLKRTFTYVQDPYLQSVDQHSIGREFFRYWNMSTESTEYNPTRKAFEDYVRSIHSRGYNPRKPSLNTDSKTLEFLLVSVE